MENSKSQFPQIQLSLTGKQDLEQFIRLICEAAINSRRWENVLEELRLYLNGNAVALAEYNFDSKEGKILHSVGYDPQHLRSYAGMYASLNVWLQAKEWYTSGQVGVGEEILPSDELVKSIFYNEWLKPMDLFHRVYAVVSQQHQRVCYLEVVRSKSKGLFNNEAQLFLKNLLPYFELATKCNHHIWESIVTSNALDQLPILVMVVDKYAHPLVMSRKAQEVLREEDGLYLSHESRVCVSGTNRASKFNALVRNSAVTSAGNGRHKGGIMMLRRYDNRPPIWVVVSPLSRRLRRVIGQEEDVALVFVYALEECMGMAQKIMLTTFYGLTPAEQRVAQAILEGYRLDEVANKLAISRNTARTHMKRIYAKTNTARQTDLIRLLLTGPWAYQSENGGQTMISNSKFG
jgi:DNA-binding CsgD family transcriptional regulator